MEYIASFSGGKDSTATIILAHEHGEPLNSIVFSEVMFDNNISGEFPEHIQFIKETCKPLFESWGYKFEILHSKKTYMDCFNHVVLKSSNPDRVGKRVGFPMAGRCVINRDCKTRPIEKFYKSKYGEYVQYIGIAIDEPKRLERLHGTNSVSILEKYGYTEKMAFELCKKYGLLSPLYQFAKRGGCWFCPNASYEELEYLRLNHRNLWNMLLALEDEPDLIGYCWNTLTKTSMKDNEDLLSRKGA